jgi:hypothetical protein
MRTEPVELISIWKLCRLYKFPINKDIVNKRIAQINKNFHLLVKHIQLTLIMKDSVSTHQSQTLILLF